MDDNSRLPSARAVSLHLLILLLALVATFLVYAGSSTFPFAYDDHLQIVQNRYVQSWQFVPRYFTSHVWSYQYPHLLSNYYRPLFLLWLRLNDAVFGLAPWGWHLTSVLLHLGVTYGVYRLARRIIQDATWAAVAALVFGLHPVHIEAVAYVSAVCDPLMVLLLLSSFMCFLRNCELPESAGTRKHRWLAASLILYAMATLTKEPALLLVPILFVYEWIFRLEKNKSPIPAWQRGWMAIRRLGPYWVVTVGYLVARYFSLKGLSHTVTPLPWSTEVMTWPWVLGSYLKLLLWPVGLSAYYNPVYVTQPGLWNCFVPGVAVLAAAAVVTLWVRGARNAATSDAGLIESRAIVFAAAWIVLALLPFLNLRALPQGEIIHDRYLYLASVGFSILVALALRRLAATRLLRARRPLVQLVPAFVLAALLGAGTFTQGLYWADELSLYTRSHEIAPENDAATTSLAAVASQRGMYGAAIELYKQVLARDPKVWRANVDLAYTYYSLGRYDDAVRYFARSIEVDPVDGNQYLYLGLALAHLGRFHEAEAAIRRALVVRPQGPHYHYSLGIVLKQQGKLPAALKEFRTELADDPGNQEAHAQIAAIESELRESHQEKSAAP